MDLTKRRGRPRLRAMVDTALGTHVKELRTDLGLTLEKLEGRCRLEGHVVTAQAINEIELGHTEEPTLRVLRALAAGLDATLGDLLDKLEPQPA